MGYIIIAAILIAIVFAAYYEYFLEKHEWNDGISPTGKPWQMFDIDSSGARGYKDEDDNVIWISYLWIDRQYNKNQ
jgi:hypothetical protein